MKIPSKEYLRQCVRDYYNHNTIKDIPAIHKREFMFEGFDGHIIRYKRFDNTTALTQWMVRNTPKGAFFSVSLFKNPEKREGFEGADVPIEFDLSEYIEEKEGHPKKFVCPLNHSDKIFCDECYKFVVSEAIKLRDILLDDFGLSESDLIIKFSGSRGFHFLITAKDFQDMNSMARASLVKYIKGENLNLSGAEFSQVFKRKKWVWIGPTARLAGWKGRAARAMEALMSSKRYPYAIKGINWNLFKKYASNINKVKEAVATGEWFNVFPPRVSARELQEILNVAVYFFRVEIDGRVTVDIKREFRIPDSFHGGAGLIAKRISQKEIDTFKPYEHAIIQGNEIQKIQLEEDISILMGGNNITGKKGDEITLQKGLAVPLIARGLASPVF